MSFQILDGHCVKLRPGTNTALGEADDALGDNFGERVGAIYKTKGLARVRERGRHFLDNVGLKGLVVQEWSDRHWFPSREPLWGCATLLSIVKRHNLANWGIVVAANPANAGSVNALGKSKAATPKFKRDQSGWKGDSTRRPVLAPYE
jgi:hypothetical protein